MQTKKGYGETKPTALVTSDDVSKENCFEPKKKTQVSLLGLGTGSWTLNLDSKTGSSCQIMAYLRFPAAVSSLGQLGDLPSTELSSMTRGPES